jgi:hypothetical protein
MAAATPSHKKPGLSAPNSREHYHRLAASRTSLLMSNVRGAFVIKTNAERITERTP